MAFAAPQIPVVRVGGDIAQPKLLKRVEPDLGAVKPGADLPWLILELLIDEKGHVSNIRVLESNGASSNKLALAAIRQWEYAPTLRHGKPVRVLSNIYFWYHVH